MTTDAEIEAATEAMRKIRTVGGKIHDDVLPAAGVTETPVERLPVLRAR